MRHAYCILLLVSLNPLIAAQDFKMEPGPKSPEESLKCIKTRPGFVVELMAAEPLVKDPIAFAWGPDGKFWVVEMGDYPLGAGGKNKAGGRIKYLEKSKPDGPYDKVTVFMENLKYPTGVFPYGKGVLITCAPHILWAQDMQGAGKADAVASILFSGFKEGNQQHRVNGLTWGIDNWIYGANGDSGGVIKSTKTSKEVDIRGRDFRFKVETGEFEAVTGQSQFGRCRDDWGNWFGCNNSNPMFHFVLEDRYLKRNPHVLYPDPRVQVVPGAIRVYPISKPLPRFNTPQGLNHFTSACSTIIYRDDFFGKDFEGNAFISEPVHNLIHRQILKPNGVTFTGARAKDEQTSEFLASNDNWFRPAMIQVGPDGALWIADMYRYVIEHPEWIPKDWQKKLDLRAGHDKGRIYRVYPQGKKPRDIPRLDQMAVEDLVKQLESPNGWVRDTAHQRLRGWMDGSDDKLGSKAGKLLHDLAKASTSAQARLHAIQCCFRSRAWGTWSKESLDRFLNDPHPAVRKHAISIALASMGPGSFGTSLDKLEKTADEPTHQQILYDFMRRYGDGSPSGDLPAERFVRVLIANADRKYVLAAGLSSVTGREWKEVFAELLKQERIPAPLLTPMMRLAKVYGEPLDSSKLFLRQLGSTVKIPQGEQFVTVGDMLDELHKSDLRLKTILESVNKEERAPTLAKLAKIHIEAQAVVKDAKSAPRDKLLAMRVLARGLGNDGADQRMLAVLLTPRTPDDVQMAVIQQISGVFDPRVPNVLLKQWKSYSPALRGQVIDTLLSRPLWSRMTLDAVERRTVPAQEIDAVRRQRFLQHKDKLVRESAAAIFKSAGDPDRGRIVDLYWLQLPEKTDAARGAKLFAKSCATCHKLAGVGQNVAPDFAAIADKSTQGLLAAILDPNKAVETRYINYIATTKKGLTVTGIIVSETSTTITLASNDGKQHPLLRNELEDLSSTGKSLMPDGLEKDLRPQDVADIIAHIQAALQSPKK